MGVRRTTTAVVLILLLGACGTPESVSSPLPSGPDTTSPTESSSTSPTASAGPTTPPPSVTPSLAAVPTPSAGSNPAQPGFGFQDILRIEVNGLAVRSGPFTSVPLATGYRDGTSIGEVRLNAGDHVSVDLGPLVIGDTKWYRVWPAEGGRLHFSTIAWDTKNDGWNPVEPGWIAAAIGTNSHVSSATDTVQEPWLDGLPMLVSGTGSFESASFEGFDYYSVDWAYTIDGQLAPCDFNVEMVADDGSSLSVVSSSTIGAFEAGIAPVGRADRTPVVGSEFGPLTLRIVSGCEWTVRVEALPHD